MQTVVDAIGSKAAKVDASVVYNLSMYLEQFARKDLAVKVLADALKSNRDKTIQARYLTLLADVDFSAAEQLQQSLP